MGEFFLTSGLVGVGVAVGSAFLFIPGIVIGLAWSLAVLIAVDKGKNPAEAITLSNNATYGNKWAMVGIYFLTCLIFSVAMGILMGIGAALRIAGFMGFLAFLVGIFEIFVFIGLQASVYRQLAGGI
jgi:uncharacterized paraquat-inducible protein A